MIRIFLPLYFILAVFFAAFVAAVIYLPDILLEDEVARYEEQVTRGTLYLLKKELEHLSPDQQEKKIEQLQQYFGFPLKIINKGNPLLDSKTWEQIVTGKFVNPIIDDAEYYFIKLDQEKNIDDSVLAVAFSDSQSELDHREASGTFYLITQKLLTQPEEKWEDIIAQMQTHFGIPVLLRLLSDLQLKPEKEQLLQQGKIIALDHDTNQWRFIGKISNSPYAIQFGPIESPMTLPVLFAIIIAIFIISLALALFFWVQPLWKSINELSRAADEFGKGKLKARADIGKNAVLGKLAVQFNAMAGRISGLISDHRELTNSVSHELRTPIARMHFELEMLNNTENLPNLYSAKRYIEGLSLDVSELEKLVNELLHYARFEELENSETLESIKIIPWMEQIIDYARGYSGHISIVIINHNLPENQIIKISSRNMSRVIHNLLRNACQYSKHMIIINIDIDNNHIHIHVDDDGPGIPKEHRNRVFKAFSRLDESRDRQSGGYGLGLAIVKRVVDAHKGKVYISDSPMGGARISLVLSVDAMP